MSDKLMPLELGICTLVVLVNSSHLWPQVVSSHLSGYTTSVHNSGNWISGHPLMFRPHICSGLMWFKEEIKIQLSVQ